MTDTRHFGVFSKATGELIAVASGPFSGMLHLFENPEVNIIEGHFDPVKLRRLDTLKYLLSVRAEQELLVGNSTEEERNARLEAIRGANDAAALDDLKTLLMPENEQ